MLRKKIGQLLIFRKIEISHGLDLYLTQGPAKVVVKADDNLQDMIIVEKIGNTLKLKVAKGSIRKAEAMDVYVSVQQLEAISASGGSDVYSEEKLQLDKFTINASGGSDLKLELDANELYCDLSGGSDTELRGSVTMLKVNASGGSDFEAKKLTAEKCKLRTSGGSDSWVHVTGEIDVEASGSSDVHYTGRPKVLHQRASGAADIHAN